MPEKFMTVIDAFLFEDWVAQPPGDRRYARPYRRLFLVSFCVLFLELVLIRWIPSYLRMFGYFTNFILMGSLLGAGLGILTQKAARLRLPIFPLVMLLLVTFVVVNQYVLNLPTTDVLFYGAGLSAANHENYWVIPVVFTFVVLVFVPFGRELGRLFDILPPLRAYGVDIAGSLAGIACFALLSYLRLPPIVWFALFTLVAWPLIAGRRKIFSALVLAGVLAIVLIAGRSDLWSPYYRIVVTPCGLPDCHMISVNNISHQEVSPISIREGFYFRAYELLGKPAFKNVLIIGAGSGTDVAVALANGVEHVDAVEIDPALYELGRKLNPEHPYDDPRVSVHIDDGRAFLRHTDGKYDLIVFALTDSLTLTSTHANLRLESFLFTTESMRQARQHLTDQGLLVLYNNYRQDWAIHKLAGMIEAAFGEQPYVTTYGAWGRAAVFLVGPRLATLPAAFHHGYAEPPVIAPPPIHPALPVVGEGLLAGDPSVIAASDDWPFFYMLKPGLPTIYVSAMAMVLAMAMLLVGGVTPAMSLRRFDWHFFLLGAAFMLLETRSLVTFSLLFGTTWMVNALVFFAILSSVLLAVAINAKVAIKRPALLYAVLFAVLAANYLVPVGALLDIGSSGLRYVLASAFAFTPVFVANIVFSRSFRDADHADSAFASNLIGLMTGGIVEYAALATGYQALLIPVAAFYAFALLARRRAVAPAPALP
jgi:Spermine/spermidine synthase domain